MTGLSRNTVANWLHGEVDGPPKYRRGEQPNKLTLAFQSTRPPPTAGALFNASGSAVDEAYEQLIQSSYCVPVICRGE